MAAMPLGLPLHGVRVLELGGYVSAPYCGRLLADYGADVVKIEPPGAGDEARRMGPFVGDDPHPEKSIPFLYLNTNKRGVTLDVADGRGSRLAGPPAPIGRRAGGKLPSRCQAVLP